MDISEPENLSTKPQDLRISNHSSKSSIKIEKKLTSPPPPIGLVAGHRADLSSPTGSTSSGICMSPYGSSPPYSPAYLSSLPPPPQKMSGPLEPICLNQVIPPSAWPYLPFNYHPHHRNHQQPFYPTAYPKPVPTPFGPVNHVSPVPQFPSSGALSHFAPFVSRESGSPPHVSPPLKTEPSYPIMNIKTEDPRIRILSPTEINTTRLGENNHHHHQHNHGKSGKGESPCC